MCQKTVPEVTNQGTDRLDQEPTNDPPGNDVIQNSNLQMGSINRAVSMAMDDESGYTKLQRPTDGYKNPQRLQNHVIETQDYSEYMVPQDHYDEYEEIPG